MSVLQRSALIVGGSGALGRVVVQRFSQALQDEVPNWTTTCLDITPNDDAHENLVLDPKLSWDDQNKALLDTIQSKGLQFDSILHVAGGFDLGDLSAGIAPVESMWDKNAKSAFTSAWLASNFLRPNGLLVLTGADSVMLGGTPYGIGYGMAKAATHHLAKSVSESGDLPEGAKTICMLPTTIDTVPNREAMPDGNFDEWIEPSLLSDHLLDWAENPNNAPDSLFVRFFSSDVDDGPYLASDHIAVVNVKDDEEL